MGIEERYEHIPSLIPRPYQLQHRLLSVLHMGKEGLVTFVTFCVWMECADMIINETWQKSPDPPSPCDTESSPHWGW